MGEQINMRVNRDALSESSSKRWRADLSDKFSTARMLGKGRGRESPLWKKFNAEWGWVVGNSWPILAERERRVHAGYPDVTCKRIISIGP